MPQEPAGFNFAGSLDPPKRSDPSSFNFAALSDDPKPTTTTPPPASRGVIGRALDAALTPLVSQERARELVGAEGALPDVPILGSLLRALKAAPALFTNNAGAVFSAVQGDPLVDATGSILRNAVHEPSTIPAMVKGLGQGAVEGAANLTDPVSLAGFLSMGVSRAIARPLLQGIRNLAEGERALVAARLASAPLPVVARLRAELQALRSGVEAQQRILQFARGTDLAGSGAVTAAGVEKLANAETLPEAAAGLFQTAMGAVGAKTATRVPEVPKAGPRHLAELPAARGYTVTARGEAVPAGTAMPPATPPPDPSYVRAVPAEYVRREVRGALPPGPRFVAAEGGVVAPVAQASEVVKSAGHGATPAASQSRVSATSAPVADIQLGGRRVYSSDPAAPSAKTPPLDNVEVGEVRRMAAEMEAMPFTKHTFLDVPGQGSTPEIVPGGAGARVYDEILDVHGTGSRPTRAELTEAIHKYLDGKPTAYAPAIREVARERLRGVRRAQLPPDAGDRPQSGLMSEDDFTEFSRWIDREAQFGSADPDPIGERGAVSPVLAQRMGGGAAGAAAGFASGDEDESLQDRLQRAIVFGAAGVAAPSLFAKRGPNGTVLRGTTRPSQTVAQVTGTPDLPTSGRAAPRPETPLRDPLANVDPFIEKFPEEMRGGLRQVLADAGGFQAQRRGAVDQEQVGRLAEQVKVDLQRRAKVGTSANAEQIAQHVNAVATTQAKVRELSERVAGGQNSDTDILALEQARAELNTVLATTMGLRAEAGRALAQFRSLARVLDSGNLQVIGDAAERLRGDSARFAAEFAQLPNDPIARYRWLQSRVTPSTMDRLRNYYYSSILSGPVTHERNFLGNAANVFTNLAVTPAAAAADAVRSRVTGAPRSVFLGEMPHQVAGAVLGIERGLSDALFSLKHGVNRSALTQSMAAAEAGKLDFVKSEFAGGLTNPFNVPSRLLDAADQLFRGIAKNQEIYGAAYAQAKREGKRGQGLTERIAELRTGNSPEAQQVQAISDTFARRSVFQEQGGPLVGLTQAAVKQFPPLSFVVPFVRTPANIFRQGFEFSPAGFGMKGVRATEGRQQSQALGRAAAGTALLAPLAWLAATGRISGSGPSNPAERAQLMESGWRPNSVRIGDQWVSYSLFQPISVQAGIIANAFEAWKSAGAKTDDVGPVAGAAILKALRSGLDQSFLSGLSDLFEAVNGFNLESASRYAGRLAHSLTPFSGAQRSVQRAMDPTVRDPEGLAQTFLANVPGQSDDLPAKQTRFGQEIVRDGGPARRALDPFNVSSVKDDVVLQLLDELQVKVGFPRVDTLRGYEPTPEEKRTLETAKGRAWYDAIAGLQAKPGFARMTPEKKRRAIADLRDRASQAVIARALRLLRSEQPITMEHLMEQAR